MTCPWRREGGSALHSICLRLPAALWRICQGFEIFKSSVGGVNLRVSGVSIGLLGTGGAPEVLLELAQRVGVLGRLLRHVRQEALQPVVPRLAHTARQEVQGMKDLRPYPSP